MPGSPILNWRNWLPYLIAAAVMGALPHETQTSCDGESARSHLGVAIACDCTVNRNPSVERPWIFRGPIHVVSVDATGPAAGVLAAGDRIIAVDDVPITDAAAAARLALLRPGASVRLTVQRGERTLVVPLTTSSICRDDARALGAYAPPLPSAARRPTSPSAAPNAPAAQRRAGGGAIAVPMLPDLESSGWLGFALACRHCGWAREAGDSAPYWESSAPPTIYAVAPESPAADAGMLPGALLTHVNGYSVTNPAGGRALGAVRPGQRIRLRTTQDGSAREYDIVAAERPPATVAADHLRFRGSLRGVTVEVNGSDPVQVSVRELDGEMFIRTAGTTIRLRAP